MKKLVAFGCFILAIQSLSQVTSDNDTNAQFRGEKVLIKAIAVFVNSNANRKVPLKHIHLPSLERPYV